jgi:hypothetical protein
MLLTVPWSLVAPSFEKADGLGIPVWTRVTWLVLAVLQYAAIGYYLDRRQLRRRRVREGRCLRCGYDLRGSPGPRCPECGTQFDPPAADQRQSFS